jgi:hypothetical protein
MNMRQIKLMVLAALATGALALPAAASAAQEPAPVVTAAGIRVTPCAGKAMAPLAMFVRGVDCKRALHLANSATSEDDPCPDDWHARHIRLKALYGGKRITGPSVFLCTQHAGKRAFTYKPITG